MSHKLWRITRHSDNSVTLTYLSPHLESGFPGRLEVYVTYTLECPPASNGNSAQLSLDYSAQLLAESLIRFDETPINLSNHAYWNLAGHLSGPNQLAEHLVEIKGHRLVELDKTTLLPTGNLLEPSPEAFEHLVVPLDQPDKRPLKDGLQGIDQPDGRTGYDHFYLFDFPCDKAERELASVWHKASRRRLRLYTNQPGLQFYTGNFLDPKSDPQGKQGTSYQPHAGLCLETGGYPNACNVDSFPVNWLTTTNGGDSEHYRHQTRLLFDLYDGVVDSS